jgi:hypothetical protein|tara:strand:+ start:146 stop:355 length:210 start_codon:yes stop_codon:yes gene_type:complete
MHRDNFQNWLSWREFKLDLNPQAQDHFDVEHLCNSLGYVPYQDFILRKSEVRFSNEEMLGIFKLNMETR